MECLGGRGECIVFCKKRGREGDEAAAHNKTQGKPRHLSDSQQAPQRVG